MAEQTIAQTEKAMAPAAARFEPGVPLTSPGARPRPVLQAVREVNPWIVALVVTMGTFMEVWIPASPTWHCRTLPVRCRARRTSRRGY